MRDRARFDGDAETVRGFVAAIDFGQHVARRDARATCSEGTQHAGDARHHREAAEFADDIAGVDALGDRMPGPEAAAMRRLDAPQCRIRYPAAAARAIRPRGSI